jgi:phosphate transport system substrate-binding protein
MSGSTTVAPLAALLAKEYDKECHHCISFKLLQGGSNVGVADVAAGRVTIGNSSRDPAATDPGGLIFNPIARDAICLITNKANTLGNLDQATTQQIFSRGVSQWSSVTGATVSGTIDLYTRNASSGTHDAFQKLVMTPDLVDHPALKAGAPVFSGAAQFSANGLVDQRVQGDPAGIGYVSLHFSTNVHPVAYQGVSCTLRNAKSGQYPAVRTLYMVTLGNATGAAGRWIHWIRTNRHANRIIASDWVPLH